MWQMVKLGDVVSYDKRQGKGSSKPYVGMENITGATMKLIGEIEPASNTSSTFLFDNRHVLFGRLRPYLQKIYLPDFEGQCSTELFCLFPANELNKKYLAYWLLSPNVSTKIISTSTGARMPRANMESVLEFEIPLPPLTEQKRIVARLDAAFAEIDKAIAAAKCKQVQTDGLKSAFLSTELSIADNQDVAAMWQTVKLSDVCTIQPAKREVKSELTDDSLVSFMGMSSLGIGRKYSSSCEVRKLKDVYKSYTYFKENDVLLAKITPCFENGKLGIAKDLSNGTGFGSSEFVVLRCSETLLPEYLYYFFLQPDFRSEGKKNMSGAVGQKRVSKDYIENTSIPLPPLTEQKRIVAKLNAVFEQADTVTANVQKQLNEYRSLKSSLLANMLVREAA